MALIELEGAMQASDGEKDIKNLPGYEPCELQQPAEHGIPMSTIVA